MKNLLKMLFRLLATLVVLGLAFAAGVVVAPSLHTEVEPTPATGALLSSSSQTQQDISLLTEAWRVIQSQYYGKSIDSQVLLGGALHGMVNALGDPYSAYLSASDVAEQNAPQSGADLQSVGLAIEKQESSLLVVAPIAASPAETAGVRPGDRILAIDGRQTASLTLGDAITLLRVPDGKPVTLTILRDGAQSDMSFVRGTVSTPLIRAKMLPQAIPYVNITAIGNPAGRDLVSFLQTFSERDVKGLILDLRNDPGGYLDTAVEIAGQFIGDGVIVSQQGRSGKTVWSYANGGKTLVIDGPDGKQSSPVRTPPLAPSLSLVVLVNRGTASAAEVLAAALQDHGRAVLIGEHTFGKGTVTGDFALSDGSVVHIADGQWLSPKGRSVTGQGLAPDITIADGGSGDAVLDRAVQYLTTNH
jgi:carboxyl-terminal processing protease